MATKVKSSKGKQVGGREKEDLLLKPPAGPFKQNKIDGTGPLKETASKEIQEAADTWFCKKSAENKYKAESKKAAEKLLKLMEYEKKTMITVYDSEEKKKKVVTIRQGEEKLKVQTVNPD